MKTLIYLLLCGSLSIPCHAFKNDLVLGKVNVLQVQIGNLIEWSTKSESSGGYFIVEKSLDGLKFSDISELPFKGEQSNKEYNFLDLDIDNDKTTYYRLKCVPKNGVPLVTETLVVHTEQSSTFSINNIESTSTIRSIPMSFYSRKNENIEIMIFDEYNELVGIENFHALMGKNKIDIDLGPYPFGVYQILLKGEQEQSITDRITVEKIFKNSKKNLQFATADY